MENKKEVVINVDEKYEDLFNIFMNKTNYLQIEEQISKFIFDSKIKGKSESLIRYFQNLKTILQSCKESSDKELIRLAAVIEKTLTRSFFASKPDTGKYSFKDLFKGFLKLITGEEKRTYDTIGNSIEEMIEHVYNMLKIIEKFEKGTNSKIVLPS